MVVVRLVLDIQKRTYCNGGKRNQETQKLGISKLSRIGSRNGKALIKCEKSGKIITCLTCDCGR